MYDKAMPDYHVFLCTVYDMHYAVCTDTDVQIRYYVFSRFHGNYKYKVTLCQTI